MNFITMPGGVVEPFSMADEIEDWRHGGCSIAIVGLCERRSRSRCRQGAGGEGSSTWLHVVAMWLPSALLSTSTISYTRMQQITRLLAGERHVTLAFELLGSLPRKPKGARGALPALRRCEASTEEVYVG